MIKYCRYYNEENKTENVVAYSTLDGMDKEVEEKHTFNGNKVLKFADTIEELCDEFVYEIDDNGFYNSHIHCPPFKFNEFVKNTEIVDISGLYKITNKYGAIWTDKGLIYVAKMNEKGELELL